MSNGIQELSKQKAETWERMKILEPKITLYEM